MKSAWRAAGIPIIAMTFPVAGPATRGMRSQRKAEHRNRERIFTAVQKLLKLRREHPALRTGKLFHLFSDDGSYVFLRQTDDEQLLIVFNNEKGQRILTIPQANTPAQKRSG